MKKNKIIFITIILTAVLMLFLIIKPLLTTYFIYEDNSEKRLEIKLGYCPTMYENAKQIAESNNYKLIGFDSASEVLSALKNKQINKALIGRKAYSYEINSEIKENVLESGFTLVSNQRAYIDISELSNLEIHTYFNQTKFNSDNLIFHSSKQEALDKISQGKIVLISWYDWNDEFELIIVMDKNQKARDFRGVFLYEYSE